jgi:hypothetical protein
MEPVVRKKIPRSQRRPLNRVKNFIQETRRNAELCRQDLGEDAFVAILESLSSIANGRGIAQASR